MFHNAEQISNINDMMIAIDLTMLAKELFPGTDYQLEQFIIVCLDPNGNMKQEYLNELRMYVNTILIFDDTDECINYITNIESAEKILFIVSDSIGQVVIPLIFELSQIIFIYIFCINEIKITCPKVVDRIFIDSISLFKKLKFDIEQCVNATLPMSILESETERSTHGLTTIENNSEFFWFQILIEILFRFDNREFWKDTMINMCELYYKDNQSELKKINDFKLSYTSDKAIWWYTRDSFLFRLVNKALRTEDIHYMIPHHFFIADLHKQLCYLHDKFIKSNNIENNILTVYRGQSMSIHELDNIKKNIGGLISMNTFLSTTTDRQIALIFAGDGTDSLRESVLFEITVDKNVRTKYVFAEISNESDFHDEQEYLFTIGTIFRIESVHKENCMWMVILKLAINDTPELKELEMYLKYKMGKKTDYYTLGCTFMKMGEFAKAEKIFKASEKMCLAGKEAIYRKLAELYGAQGNCSLALDYANQTLEQANVNKPSLVAIHTLLGQLHWKNGSFHIALNNLRIAQEILSEQSITDENHESLFGIYETFGGIYQKLDDISRALGYYEKCVKLQEQYLPKYHFDKAALFKRIGVCYEDKKDHKMALIYHQKTLEIQLKCLKHNHQHIACTYNDIGLCYFYQNDPISALYYYEKADEIFSFNSSCDPTIISALYSNMGLFCFQILHNHSLALEYLNKSLNIQLKISSDNNYRLIRIYNNMSGAHYQNGKQILVNSRSDRIHTHPSTLMGDSLNELKLALTYSKKAYEIAVKMLPPNHHDIINCQDGIEILKSNIKMLKETKSMFN